MPFNFDIHRVIQLTAYCVRQGRSKRMNILRLMKLLYIADRESLRAAGYVLTGDAPYALKHGPVLSKVYNLCRPDSIGPSADAWRQYFRAEDYNLHLVAEPGEDRLSEHDKRIVSQVVEDHRCIGTWRLRDLTHTFPEWQKNDPGNSSRPIPLGDILDALDRHDDVEAIERTKREDDYFAAIFGG